MSGLTKLRAAVRLPGLRGGQSKSTKRGQAAGMQHVDLMLADENYIVLYTDQDPESTDPLDRVPLEGFDGTMYTLRSEVVTSKPFFEAVARFLETATYLGDNNSTPLVAATAVQYLSNIKNAVALEHPNAQLCERPLMHLSHSRLIGVLKP
jgi:hypothetical protein